MTAAFFALLGYTIIREVMYYVTTQKLVNKLMSRDFVSYQYGQKADWGTKKVEAKESAPESTEDLGVLSDYAAT